jgi:hypothetical protein
MKWVTDPSVARRILQKSDIKGDHTNKASNQLNFADIFDYTGENGYLSLIKLNILL